MHCAVQLSAFLYRAMYWTMQQPLTRTAALKIKWSTDCLLNDTQKHTHLINKYNMNTLIFYNSKKKIMSFYSYCPISLCLMHLLKEAGD